MSFTAECPFCRLMLQGVPDDRAGSSVECPRCHNLFTLVGMICPRQARRKLLKATTSEASPLAPAADAASPMAVLIAAALDSGSETNLVTDAPRLPASRPIEPGGTRGDLRFSQPPEEATPVFPGRRVNRLGLASFLFSTFGLLCASIPGMALFVLPLVGAGLVLGLLGVVTRSAGTGSICAKSTDARAESRGIALPLAGLAVSVPVLLVASFWPRVLDLRSQGTRPREDANKETVFHLAELGVARREVPKESEWVDASKDALQHGGVRVRVDSVAVRSAELKDTKGKSHPSDRSLVIRLRISNVSFDHLVEYTSWGKASSADQVSLPDLKDNLGRSYTMRTFAPGWTVAGQVRRAAIPGAKWVDDVLVFEPPPARIEYLRLELPATAVGTKGTFKLEIPRRMIRFP